ncbi:MAG: ubiquitin-like small modifier protein 1 [Dehalococcoidia bacterium]|nr:ubiquitin-like small modifier protein 1 [Dehalococcoidia bacterium]
MTVEVRVTANLQKMVGGKRSVQAEGASVRELLDDLDSRYPGFKKQIVTDGQIHRFVNIYLNDEDIRFLDKLDTPLKEGDTLSILPALAGGRA